MQATGPPAISQLLAKWREGDHEALRALVPLLYDVLRQIAHQYLRNTRPRHTLQTTALVPKTYLRLEQQHTLRFQNRQHFVAVCPLLMRQILMGYERTRRSDTTIALDEAIAPGKWACRRSHRLGRCPELLGLNWTRSKAGSWSYGSSAGFRLKKRHSCSSSRLRPRRAIGPPPASGCVAS